MPSWAWVGLGLRAGRGLCSGARSVLHVVAKIFAFVTVKVASASFKIAEVCGAVLILCAGLVLHLQAEQVRTSALLK